LQNKGAFLVSRYQYNDSSAVKFSIKQHSHCAARHRAVLSLFMLKYILKRHRTVYLTNLLFHRVHQVDRRPSAMPSPSSSRLYTLSKGTEVRILMHSISLSVSRFTTSAVVNIHIARDLHN